MRRTAAAALDRYDLEIERFRHLAQHTNTVFRVDTPDGPRALRVGAPPEDTLVDTRVEVAWLAALAADTSISVVQPLPNREGSLITPVEVEGVPGVRTCVLFSWVPGRAVAEAASPDVYRRLGETAAVLHDHGETWRPPKGSPLVWDRTFYYPDESVILFDVEHRHLMDGERTRIVRRVLERAEAELARHHADGRPGIVHGDLHPDNVHWHRGRLHVFDFEDAMVARPVQDVAITLFYGRNRPDYSELRAAFEEGYRSRREWPVEFEGQLELLMAARTIMFINYVLRLGLEPEEYLPQAVDRIAANAERFEW